MSEYKLVPVEPTLEMMEAGAEGCGQDLDRDEARGRAFVAYKAMLAAAPAVQGEPVGYVRPHHLEMLRSGKVCGITMEDKPDAHNGVTIPLFAAQQPAEQQEAWLPFGSVTEREVFERWAERFDHDGDQWEDMGRDDIFIAGMRAAPDVSALVEALEQCITSMLDSGYRANTVVIRAARVALADHRKQGGGQ